MLMNIFDEEMNPIESPDLEKGKLERKFEQVIWRYILECSAEGHYEVIQEYPNGGKDVEWVIDIPEQGYWEARFEDDSLIDLDKCDVGDKPTDSWDKGQMYQTAWEYYIYVPYTTEELEKIKDQKAELERQSQIDELKQSLIDTDYMVMKIMEYQIGGIEMPEEDAAKYADIMIQREEWRNKINELEDGGDADV